MDVRAMDTDTARRKKKKKKGTFLETSDGEAESVVNANLHHCGSGCTQTLTLRVLKRRDI